jgi:hypothetical protein
MSVQKNDSTSATFTHNYVLKNFTWKIFPQDVDRFCITVVTDNKDTNLTKNFITYLTNCFQNKNFFVDNNFQNILKTYHNKLDDKIQDKTFIIDCSENEIFKNTLVELNLDEKENKEDYIPIGQLPSCLQGLVKFRINYHNLDNFFIENSQKNLSHNICLTDKITPELSSNSNMIFFFDINTTLENARKSFGIGNIPLHSDNIYVFTKLMQQNIEILFINKKRFMIDYS